jgi:hypothetical protein
MYSRLSGKLVSLFLILSVCLLGYVSMSTWGAPTPTAGKVAISDQVQIKQGVDVSYYFADDAYLDKLEVRASYLEINSQFRLSTGISTGEVNITLERYSVSSSMLWTADPGSADPIVTFTLSGLESGAQYYVKVDGNRVHQLWATGSGTISFTYAGPWSEHTFEVVRYNSPSHDMTAFSITFLGIVVVMVLLMLLLMLYEKVKKAV